VRRNTLPNKSAEDTTSKTSKKGGRKMITERNLQIGFFCIGVKFVPKSNLVVGRISIPSNILDEKAPNKLLRRDLVEKFEGVSILGEPINQEWGKFQALYGHHRSRVRFEGVGEGGSEKKFLEMEDFLIKEVSQLIET
jgi:hypothetical protein